MNECVWMLCMNDMYGMHVTFWLFCYILWLYVNVQFHYVCLQWVTSSMSQLAPLVSRHFQFSIVFKWFIANKIWWWLDATDWHCKGRYSARWMCRAVARCIARGVSCRQRVLRVCTVHCLHARYWCEQRHGELSGDQDYIVHDVVDP